MVDKYQKDTETLKHTIEKLKNWYVQRYLIMTHHILQFFKLNINNETFIF